MGLTLRTEAAHLSDDDLRKTANHLIRHWSKAVDNREKNKAPFLLSQGPDSLFQILREYGSAKHDRLVFDQAATLKSAQGWAREFAPDLKDRMMLHQDNRPLFEHYGVEAELDRLFEKHIPLKSGAWITIEQTEAMVVVDVNMGNANFSNDPEKQRLKVNYEAAREIFRQIRLRGLSGIIIIDFINMPGKSDVSNLLGVVDNLILESPTQIQRSNLSAFGLLELTRKASHLALSRHMLADGHPRATVATTALALLRRAEQDAATKPGIPVTVTAGPDVLAWLNARPTLLTLFTRRTGSTLDIKGSKS